MRADQPESGAEDVVAPGLVEQDHRQQDEREDADHDERVVGRGGVGGREAVGEARRRDHHPRVELGEQEDDGEHDRGGGRGEGERPRGAGGVRTTAATAATAATTTRTMPGKTSWSFLSIPTASVQTRKAAPRSTAGTAERRRERNGARMEVAGGAERQVDGAVEREERDERDPGDDGVRREEVPEGAGELLLGRDREAVEQARERRSPRSAGSRPRRPC